MEQPNTETRVYAGPTERVTRLAALDLSESHLGESVEYGARYAADCTAHDPPNLAGYITYGKATRGLRDNLVPLGWLSRDSKNYCRVVHPTGAFAIVVAGGDAFTGRADENPTTRSNKGPLTLEAVAQNQRSFAELASDPTEWVRAGVNPQFTWFLLHYIDNAVGEIRAELSLPAAMSHDGHVSAWRERSILETIPFTPIPFVDEEDQDDEGDTDINVERRA